ncbi:hypothetical protein O9Z70_13385 [Devosia sp. YIM 151766]|uniref:hypothetical protein n=1 Tax=Devosia sp. YIM 151766 TaxID=3017325 RepID=UPI00255CD72D|nr:hypothetical protein [Devosia sp. YIM 151766]WIY52442.1 hypothetical protein O9Z70_13385 [Devosia sp. YIM 151766]
MTLPPRVFFSSFEAAARWGCTPTDIVEWAAMERLQLTTSAPFIQTSNGPLSGLIELHAADLMPMFRRDGTGPTEVPIHRVRPPGEATWAFIMSPQGLMVARPDILISAIEKARFEEENGLARRTASGRPNHKYDWEAMFVAVIKRIHERGLPDTQAEFVREFQEWFARRDEKGEAPDERSIRRRLTPVWRALQ